MSSISSEEVFKTLSPDGQEYAKKKGQALVCEYQNLQAIRKKLGLTQNDVSELEGH